MSKFNQLSPSLKAFLISVIFPVGFITYTIFKFYIHSPGEFNDTFGLFFFFVPLFGIFLGLLVFPIIYTLFRIKDISSSPSRVFIGLIFIVTFVNYWIMKIILLKINPDPEAFFPPLIINLFLFLVLWKIFDKNTSKNKVIIFSIVAILISYFIEIFLVSFTIDSIF